MHSQTDPAKWLHARHRAVSLRQHGSAFLFYRHQTWLRFHFYVAYRVTKAGSRVYIIQRSSYSRSTASSGIAASAAVKLVSWNPIATFRYCLSLRRRCSKPLNTSLSRFYGTERVRRLCTSHSNLSAAVRHTQKPHPAFLWNFVVSAFSPYGDIGKVNYVSVS